MSDQQVVYHSVLPENLKSYGPFDQADFICTYPANRAMEVGSVRLEGTLNVQDNNLFLDNAANKTKQIQLDHLVGAHSFCESFVTTLGGGSRAGTVIENLTEYPRYVKMATSATQSNSDMNNAGQVCELKASTDVLTRDVMQGIRPKGSSAGDPSALANPLRLSPDFAIRPNFVLNGGAGVLSHQKTGDIRISVTFARVAAALFGNDMATTVDYQLDNLRITFRSRPMPQKDEPVMLKTKIPIKSSLQSSLANIQTLVPGVCLGMSATFQPQGEENSLVNNNTQLSKIPNLKTVQFLFNDSTNTLISYLIKSETEVIDRYIDSLLDTGRNELSRAKLADNNGFGIGIDFDQALSLDREKFSMQISSDITSTVPFLAYMYFHSFIEV